MALPTKATPHTATLRSHRQQFVLAYDNGTAAFTPGKTLTGATSHATAVIVSTGDIVSGSLYLHTITGTFLNNEAIVDNGTTPGSALVNGTIEDAFDTSGQLVYSDIDATIACRFYSQNEAVQKSGQAMYIVTSQKVMIPSDVTPLDGDQLITTATGYEGTYTIGPVLPAPGLSGGPHHWTCTITKGGV